MRRIAVHPAILRRFSDHSDLTDPAEVAHHAEAARDYGGTAGGRGGGPVEQRVGADRDAVSQYERAPTGVRVGDAERPGLLDALVMRCT